MDLTVQDIHNFWSIRSACAMWKNFVDAINEGREAIGEPALSSIEFDESEPNYPANCLSARHLFAVGARGYVGTHDATTKHAAVLRQTFGTGGEDDCVEIPEEILKVTRVFDSLARLATDPGERKRLRNLFVEAGYVAP